jgi:predicted nuclease of predicted toxin-antitoxin system
MTWRTLAQPPARARRQIQRQISGKAKFLIDENLGSAVARVIRSLDQWHVEYAGEVGLHGKPDEEVYEYAFNRQLWILTHDRDFLNPRRFPFEKCHGVVVLPGANGNEPPLLRAITDVLLLIGDYANLFTTSKIKIADGRIWTIWQWNAETSSVEKWRLRLEDDDTVSEWQA